MTKIRIAKIAGITAGAVLAFGSFVPMAGAVTIAELQAQINQLMAQLSSLQGSAVVGTAITSDLTIGSSGSQVVALQQALVAGGYLTMPSGVAMGYFGSLTKAAVMRWQAANGVSATGYFGPISRAKFNGSAGATGTVPGTTIGGTTTGGGVITTPGVEGTLTVSKNPSPASGAKLYEGSTKVGVLGLKLEAKTSDIKIERIKLDLDCSTCSPGTDNDFYRKIAQRVYVMDGSTVLASMDLNSSTVVEDGNDRFITVSGLSYVVPKNATRVLTVALDAYSTWDSTYDGDTWTIGVQADGVRGVDGAGVNQYGPSTGFTNDFTSQADLTDSATFAVSTSASTPAAAAVVASQGSSKNELSGLTLLNFDVRAEKDAVTLTDLAVDVVRTGSGGATTTTGYLYDGSTLVGSDSIDTDSHAGFTFSNIDYVVPKDTTKTFTVKVDIASAAATATIFTADIDTADVTSESSSGTAITETGSAQGESITVRSVGPEFTLLSKSIAYHAAAGYSGATSSAQADFVVRIKAVGGDIEFGDAASTTYALAEQDNTLAAGESFVVYLGGAVVHPAVASSTSIAVSSGGGLVAAGGANSWKLAENNTIDIPISFIMEARTTAGSLITTGAYSIGLERLNWLSNAAGRQTDTFMSGKTGWRTGTVTLP